MYFKQVFTLPLKCPMPEGTFIPPALGLLGSQNTLANNWQLWVSFIQQRGDVPLLGRFHGGHESSSSCS